MENKNLSSNTPDTNAILSLIDIKWFDVDTTTLGLSPLHGIGSWEVYDEKNNSLGLFEDFDYPTVKRRGLIYYKMTEQGWKPCSEQEAKELVLKAEMGDVQFGIIDQNKEMGYIPAEWKRKHPTISDDERRRNGEKLYNQIPTEKQPGEE